MKLVDANVLLYSVNVQADQHTRARDWLTRALTSTEAVGLPWASLLAFVRVSTNPRIFDRNLTTAQALDVVEAWLGYRSVVTPAPTPRHPAILRGILETHGTGGNLVTDAHLAALAAEHGAEIVTFDRDFARFDVRCTLLA
jgi:uncharacterized protein